VWNRDNLSMRLQADVLNIHKTLDSQSIGIGNSQTQFSAVALCEKGKGRKQQHPTNLGCLRHGRTSPHFRRYSINAVREHPHTMLHHANLELLVDDLTQTDSTPTDFWVMIAQNTANEYPARRRTGGWAAFRANRRRPGGYLRGHNYTPSLFRESGSSRMRFPVAAKIALQRAGANGGTPGSPTPAGGALLLVM